MARGLFVIRTATKLRWPQSDAWLGWRLPPRWEYRHAVLGRSANQNGPHPPATGGVLRWSSAMTRSTPEGLRPAAMLRAAARIARLRAADSADSLDGTLQHQNPDPGS